MKKILFAIVCVLVFTLSAGAQTTRDFVVENMNFDPETDTFSVLLDDNRDKTTEIPTVEMSLNGTLLENAENENLLSANVPVVWTFLVDTTPSVYASEKEAADDVAQYIFSSRGADKGDSYVLMTFGTKVTVEGIASEPGIMLKELQFTDADEDYTAAISYAYEYLGARNGFEKQVVILFTDGARGNDQSISQTRLEQMLAESNIQLYTIGLRNSNLAEYNNEDIDLLSRLAQAGHGKGFSTKTEASHQQIAKLILDDANRTMLISGTVPASFIIPEDMACSLQIDLKRADATTIESVADSFNWVWDWNHDPAEGAASELIDQPSLTENVETSADTLSTVKAWLAGTTLLADREIPNLYLACAAAAILVLIIVLIIVSSVKKSKAKKAEAAKAEAAAKAARTVNVRLSDGMNSPVTVSIEEGETKLFGRADLPDKNIIGLNGDPAISSRHFSLSYDMNNVYLADEGSSNGTILDGIQIHGKTRVTNGQTILVGETEYKITFGNGGAVSKTSIVNYD